MIVVVEMNFYSLSLSLWIIYSIWRLHCICCFYYCLFHLYVIQVYITICMCICRSVVCSICLFYVDDIINEMSMYSSACCTLHKSTTRTSITACWPLFKALSTTTHMTCGCSCFGCCAAIVADVLVLLLFDVMMQMFVNKHKHTLC